MKRDDKLFAVLSTGQPISVTGPIKPLKWEVKGLKQKVASFLAQCEKKYWMAQPLHDPTVLPGNLPVPQDDGAARHLQGAKLPDIALAATNGVRYHLSGSKDATSSMSIRAPAGPVRTCSTGWDGIPGARGCTPQSCSFRDHFAELKALGVKQLYGLSTQDPSPISARRWSGCICRFRSCRTHRCCSPAR